MLMYYFFFAQLFSLKDVWRQETPWFCDWFTEYQADVFKTCLILSAREELGIKGRYYNNALVNRHKSQKKKLLESIGKQRDLKKITDILGNWVNENYLQEISLALRGLGKFRLAADYEQLAVNPKTWFHYLPETREAKIQHFLEYNADPSNQYKKPVNAGKKGKASAIKRRADQVEPELFLDPVVIKKNVNSWEV